MSKTVLLERLNFIVKVTILRLFFPYLKRFYSNTFQAFFFVFRLKHYRTYQSSKKSQTSFIHCRFQYVHYKGIDTMVFAYTNQWLHNRQLILVETSKMDRFLFYFKYSTILFHLNSSFSSLKVYSKTDSCDWLAASNGWPRPFFRNELRSVYSVRHVRYNDQRN